VAFIDEALHGTARQTKTASSLIQRDQKLAEHAQGSARYPELLEKSPVSDGGFPARCPICKFPAVHRGHRHAYRPSNFAQAQASAQPSFAGASRPHESTHVAQFDQFLRCHHGHRRGLGNNRSSYSYARVRDPLLILGNSPLTGY
jgi:hypothetical protein